MEALCTCCEKVVASADDLNCRSYHPSHPKYSVMGYCDDCFAILCGKLKFDKEHDSTDEWKKRNGKESE